MIFDAIKEAVVSLQEALAVSTMLRHRRAYERRLRRLVRRMFRQQAAAVVEATVRFWPPSDDVLGAALRGVSMLHSDDFGDVLADAYTSGFNDGERELKEDLEPSFVTREMRRRAGDRITGIDATTREQIRALLETAIAENWSYTKIAASIRRMFADFGRAVPQRHIRDRAELIAVTEAGQAFMDGQSEQARQREARGIVIEKSWLTVGDDRVSEGCIENQRQGWIPFGQAFRSGHTSPLRFPGCRCAMQTRKKAA